MSDKFENRAYQFELRAETDEQRGNIITGRPIVYGSITNIGPYDEVIEPGALVGCDLKDVRFLVNHDLSRIPLARSRNNNANSTMQLMPNEFGMDIRVDLDTENNTESKALYSAVDRGDISGMSFRFRVGEEEWENLQSDHPIRHIKKITRVIEVSAVTVPAYDATTIQARDISDALENARAALESARNVSLESDLELEKLKIKYRFL